jgi:acetoacetyl-[acyl-carrier protein] synthase
MDTSFINSKGFGGNNATAAILAPHIVIAMMEKRHGKKKITQHAHLNEAVKENTHLYDEQAIAGANSIIYQFGAAVVEGQDLGLSPGNISIPGYEQEISLDIPNPYKDMT